LRNNFLLNDYEKINEDLMIFMMPNPHSFLLVKIIILFFF